MRVVGANLDVTSGDPVETHYRVRLWEPPPADDHSWFLDEWDVYDAVDFLEVLDWARSSSVSGTFEILVPAGGDLTAPAMRAGTEDFLRLYGRPGDVTTTELVVLYRMDEE